MTARPSGGKGKNKRQGHQAHKKGRIWRKNRNKRRHGKAEPGVVPQH